MRSSLIIIVLILFTISSASSQHTAFQTLKNKFKGEENVVTLSSSGFMVRTILLLAGAHDFRKAIKEVDRLRLITIPKAEFEHQRVSVNGFKKVLYKNDYEMLGSTIDHGDRVTLYLQSGEKHHEHYFLLVENPNEVIAIEIKGEVDHRLMFDRS